MLPGTDGRVERDDPGLVRMRKQMSRGAWLAALAVRDPLGDVAERTPTSLDPAEIGTFFAVGP